MNFFPSNNIRLAILIPFALILILIIGLFIGTGYVRYKQAHDLSLKNTLKQIEDEYRSQLNDDAEMMHIAIASLLTNEKILKAFRSRDRQALFDLTKPMFDHFKEDHFFTHFYFITPERETFLRVHQFNRHSDTINRLTMAEAEKTGKSAYGLELGVFGTFTLRMVVPWRVDGRLIGFIELGEEIDHITDSIAERFDLHLLTTIKKDLLQREKWEVGQQFVGYQAHWNLFDDVVIIGKTSIDLSETLQEFISKHVVLNRHKDEAHRFEDAGRQYLMDFFSLVDFGKREVGDLIVIQDETDQNAAFRQSMMIVGFASIMSGGAIFMIFFVILGRVENRLQKSQDYLENEVRERTKTLSDTQQLVNLGSWSHDLTQDELYWSDEVYRIFGYELDKFEATFEAFLATIHPDDLSYVNEQYQGAVEGKHPYDIEHRIIRQDTGEVRWVHEKCEHTRNSDGEIIRSDGSVQDITKRKKVERELHISQWRHQQLIDSTHEGYWFIDPSGTTLDVNPALCKILGRSREEVIEGTIYDFVDEENTEIFKGQLEKRKEDIFGSYEISLQRPDGTNVPCINNPTPIYDRDGTHAGSVGLWTDISELKKTSQILEDAKVEAEAANQSKSAFLANMSHEIRTPMNGVIGMLDVLMHSRMSDDDAKMVDTIRHSANSLLGIIDDILDFSKIEAGKLGLSESPIHVEHEFDAVCNLLDRVALDKQVELTMFYDPEIPEALIGDALRFRQILTNLTNNALKFSSGLEHTGRVYLRADLDRSEDNRVWVNFSVSDNGIGIDTETQARLFQPFEQAEGGTTRIYGGTGLGLVISQSLAELMGGKIEVKSEVGEGATFSICLPFSIRDTDVVAEPPYDLTSIEAVVVCDEPKYVEDYTRYLIHAGAKVYSVEELEKGWDLIARRNLFEPICMMVMEEPGMKSAQEIVDRLIAKQPDKDVRIVQVAYLNIERGKRRAARRLSENVIQIDREVLTRRRLLGAVALSTGRVTIEEINQERSEYADLPQPQTREEAIAAGCLILVAEDNEINLEVIQRQLALLGYTADLTKDGVEAYDKWQSGDYGLLLTDLHMPNRDGYELTTLIRKTELEHGKDRTPIIALTANALKGEEERCLQTGMDAYLSKPLALNLLKEALQQWLPEFDDGSQSILGERATPVTEQKTSEEDMGQAVDPSILTQIVGDDPALHRQFLEKFIEPAAQIVSEIHVAFEAGSAEQIGELGHKLKSSSRTIGANPLADLCDELEKAGKADDWEKIKILHTELDGHFEAVRKFIEND